VLAAVALLAPAVQQADRAEPLKPAKNPRVIESRYLTITLSQSVVAAAPGDRVELFIDVVPKANVHVYSPEQTGGYIPIALTFEPAAGVSMGKPVFPKSSAYYFKPLDETFRVFDKPFRISVTATVGSGKSVSGTLRYQACDDTMCYRPITERVDWKMGTDPIYS
jgi:hypothetical protein